MGDETYPFKRTLIVYVPAIEGDADMLVEWDNEVLGELFPPPAPDIVIVKGDR